MPSGQQIYSGAQKANNFYQEANKNNNNNQKNNNNLVNLFGVKKK
jgi:hypothetical protein